VLDGEVNETPRFGDTSVRLLREHCAAVSLTKYLATVGPRRSWGRDDRHVPAIERIGSIGSAWAEGSTWVSIPRTPHVHRRRTFLRCVVLGRCLSAHGSRLKPGGGSTPGSRRAFLADRNILPNKRNNVTPTERIPPNNRSNGRDA
jgi:hypothetical protein